MCSSERISIFNISWCYLLVYWYVQWTVRLDIEIHAYEFTYEYVEHISAHQVQSSLETTAARLQTAVSSEDRRCEATAPSMPVALSKINLTFIWWQVMWSYVILQALHLLFSFLYFPWFSSSSFFRSASGAERYRRI